MDGTAGDPTVAKAKGRLVLELVVIMLVGIFIGLAVAVGLSWATDGFISLWAVMFPVFMGAVLVPLWIKLEQPKDCPAVSASVPLGWAGHANQSV